MKRANALPVLQALVAALLFGASAPLAKLLLGEVDPLPLAALLYLGCGLGLLLIKGAQRLARNAPAREAGLTRADLPWLAGAALAGGVAAPVILLFSLRDTPAATASLLLNFEAVATTLIAWLAFRESIGRRAWGAIAAVTLGSVLLTLQPGAGWGFSPGAAGIALACVLWGLDNNFTRNIAARDPVAIVTVKGLAAGCVSLTLAVATGSHWPGLWVLLGALLLGSLSYGASIVLSILAMRALGSARTSALFGTSPLAGVLVSFLVFREAPGWMFIPALPLVMAGAFALVGETHGHTHTHVSLEHDHAHRHDDDHHVHAHEIESHAHAHTHDSLEHEHDHMPDLHHRHDD